jgi:hypothetical protein
MARQSDPARYAEVNASLERPTIGERLDDPEFVRRYPVARRLAPESSRLDLLLADDREAFP